MEFCLPELGEDAGDSAKVTFWYVAPGDQVEKGQDLVEMMTDKATFNVDSPVKGRISEIRVREGDAVSVGEVLCVIDPAE